MSVHNDDLFDDTITLSTLNMTFNHRKFNNYSDVYMIDFKGPYDYPLLVHNDMV